jgi:hypothetical protein
MMKRVKKYDLSEQTWQALASPLPMIWEDEVILTAMSVRRLHSGTEGPDKQQKA